MLKKTLITGAGGFLGSHLVEHMVRQNRSIRAFVMYNSFNSWGWLDNCDLEIRGQSDVFAREIRDSHGVKTAMEGCDNVLHLAGLIDT